MTTRKKVQIKVIEQGAPVVQLAWLVLKTKNFAAFEVDMQSKWCEVDCSGGVDNLPMVSIGTNSRSTYLSYDGNQATMIGFPEFPGWDVWVAECSRYTLRVCLQKTK